MEDINDFIASQNFISEQLNNNKYKEESSLQSVKFATYRTPVFKEKFHKLWVSRGSDNMFPNYLINITNNCPLHSAIITNKVQNVIGEGLQIEDSQDKDMLASQAEFLKNSQVNKLLRRCVSDYEMLGYFFIGITWSNDRTKIAKMYHVDASTICVGTPNKETGEVDHFYFSEDWSQHKKKDFAPQRIECFDPARRIDANCLLMIRGYRPNTRFYNLPSWIGATTAIELSYEIGNYMLNSIKNGLSPSMNINFNNGSPSDEEKMAIYQSVKQLYAGSNNAGKAIFSFNQSPANATTIQPIETSNMSEIYSRLSEFCDNSIIRAHQIPNPVLAGVAVPGQLGLSNELAQSAALYLNNVIYPTQLLFEETIQDLLAINDFNIKVYIKDNHPINFTYDDSTLLNILTVNELRKRIGMPPIAESDIPNLGINISEKQQALAPATPTPAKADGMSDDAEPAMPVNSVITGLSGRQHQALLRIVKQVSNGKLTRAGGAVLLSTGYGLSEDQIDAFLGSEEEEAKMAVSPQVPKYVNELPNKKKKLND